MNTIRLTPDARLATDNSSVYPQKRPDSESVVDAHLGSTEQLIDGLGAGFGQGNRA